MCYISNQNIRMLYNPTVTAKNGISSRHSFNSGIKNRIKSFLILQITFFSRKNRIRRYKDHFILHMIFYEFFRTIIRKVIKIAIFTYKKITRFVSHSIIQNFKNSFFIL